MLSGGREMYMMPLSVHMCVRHRNCHPEVHSLGDGARRSGPIVSCHTVLHSEVSPSDDPYLWEPNTALRIHVWRARRIHRVSRAEEERKSLHVMVCLATQKGEAHRCKDCSMAHHVHENLSLAVLWRIQ